MGMVIGYHGWQMLCKFSERSALMIRVGGISGECVDDRLQLRSEKGIFLCGEILDIDGDCGGYNLQWAWSSGIFAGRNCAESLRGAAL